MEFQVFGPIRIRADGRATTVGGRLQRVLLGVLLCLAGAMLPTDVLAGTMWGERDSARAASNLHIHVHRPRRLLPEPGRSVSEPGCYRLAVGPGELDVDHLETLLDEGAALRPQVPERAAEVLRLEPARSLAREIGDRFVQAWVRPLALVYWRAWMREEAFACAEECLSVALEHEEDPVEWYRRCRSELRRIVG